ncbi:MAG: phosphoenolpyruvate carboxylase [Myxococcota bacterium]|jgi:phosphoenolpyruvate carboxylase
MTNLSDILEYQQESILQIYLKNISSEELILLEQFLPFLNPEERVEDFFALSVKDQIIIANHLARICDIQFRTRNAINSQFSKHIAKESPFDAFSFDFTLQELRERNFHSPQIQNLLDQNIISNSITAHPTNPYSTDYTIASMQLDRILATRINGKLEEQIKKLIKINPVPLVSDENEGKKTGENEVFEALSYMKNIYYHLPKSRLQIQESLEKAGFSDIKIGNFYELCVWLSGDGDGNSNATAEALQNNIDIFKKEIINFYSEELSEIQNKESNSSSSYFHSHVEKDPAKFISYLKKLPQNQRICDLIYRVQNFGFHFAKIDIRHCAEDIKIAANEIKKIAGNKKPEEILSNLKNDIAVRIFSRFLVVAENPEFFDKLIIAECKKSEDVLNAMFLLDKSGSKPLNIITLSESVEDLSILHQNIETLLENDIYRNHVVKKEKLYYMIAKSDTQRRDGVGAQFAGELAIQNTSKSFFKLQQKYPELQKVKLIPFNGGGHALQRGGGRIDEIPNIYAKCAMRVLETNSITISPPILTTQGHQNGILFSATNTDNFLTSYFSQGIYAAAKMSGLLNDFDNSDPKYDLARKNREFFSQAAQRNYQKEIVTENSPINILFKQAPWASVELSNVSSRPSKRVENSSLQLIDQRAIGAERMCAHSGTHLISWYSSKAGLEEIGEEKARLMYFHDKGTRDSFRNIAMSLAMTDFDVAWKMMIGDNRPNLNEIYLLSEKYRNNEFADFDEKTQNRITLAHIEIEAIKTAKLIDKIIVNDDNSSNLPRNLLTKLWGNLAIRIENREKRLKFAHLLEAKITFDLPDIEKRYPQDQQAKQLIRAINAACTGSESPNITLIRSINRELISSFENDLSEELQEKLSII